MPKRIAKLLSSVRRIPTLVRLMQQAHAEPVLYRILGGKDARVCLEAVDLASGKAGLSLQTSLQSVLFIHGAEYRNAHEVMRDLIGPFFKSAQIPMADVHTKFHVYLLCWNSSLLCHTAHAQIAYLLRSLGRPLSYLLLANHWGKFYADMEQRALEAANHIFPFVHQNFACGPGERLVVTHSMGAYVWANVIKRLQHENLVPEHLGTWWSMQSALPHDAFAKDGVFHMIPTVYEATKSKYELWYSRWDVVLGCFYFAVKRRWAQGQVGCVRPDFGLQFDLTKISREAHGATALFPRQGDFWQRIGHFLRARLAVRQSATSL